jgi:hypothetical protein
MKRIACSIIALTALVSGLTTSASAQLSSATTGANAAATIVTAISLTKTADMNFSDVVTGATSGTVELTASASPSRSALGGTRLGNSTGISSATFTVAGDPEATYSISLPVVESELISGIHLMTVDSFSSSPIGSGLLSESGFQTLYVGATLNVGASQANGSYTGTFEVTVAYN